MQQQGEPSVEEILDSIKKVIARDTVRAPVAEPRQPAEEVLELGEDTVVNEESEDGPLTGEGVRASMQDNFAALAMLSEPGRQPQIVRSGETSLEGMVRDMLRPMLARWLDDNLPEMVEKLVKAEIARIAGKRDAR